jgi:hypothetical protein
MINKFDDLAKIALDEASLGDYMKAVTRTTGRVVGTAAKVAGTAVKAAGSVYSAIGGTQGGALLKKVGGAVQTAGSGLQKLSSPSEVFALQRKKALPSKGDIISVLTPSIKGRNRFTVQTVEADPKSGINITAKPQGDISDKFDSIVIKTSGGTGLQSGDASITFMQGNALSTLKPVRVSTQRTDIGGVNAWRLTSSPERNKVRKKIANKQANPKTKNTRAPKKVTNTTTQTKAGTPVAAPTAAQVRSMNLPTHPLTSTTPPHRP